MRLGDVTCFTQGPKPQLCQRCTSLPHQGPQQEFQGGHGLRGGWGRRDINHGRAGSRPVPQAQGAHGKMEEASQREHVLQGLEGWTEANVQGLWSRPVPPEPGREGAGKWQAWRPDVQPQIGSCCQSATSAEPGPGAEERGHQELQGDRRRWRSRTPLRGPTWRPQRKQGLYCRSESVNRQFET